MFCHHCGSQGVGRFCTSCGRPLEGRPAVQTLERMGSIPVNQTQYVPAPFMREPEPVGAYAHAPVSPVYAPDIPGAPEATKVTVNVAGPRIQYRDTTEPGLLLRGLWFVFLGWYLGFFWITLAALLNATIVGLPLGLMMFNAVPRVMTLKSRHTRLNLTAGADGTYVLTRSHVEQRAFWKRALYFLLIGWWFSLLWAWTAYAIGLLIITLPVSFWMFDRLPALTTLARY